MNEVMIGTGDLHTKEMQDDGTGVNIEFTYRLPSNRERAAYQAKAAKVKGRKKMVIRTALAAKECVLPLIVAFRFTSPAPERTLNIIRDDQPIPLSSRSADPGYVPEWKKLLVQHLPHLVEGLGNTIFAGVTDDEGNIVFDYGDDGGSEDVPVEDMATADDPADEEFEAETVPNG